MVSIKEITEYWDNQPCNVLNATGEKFSKEYFDSNSKNRYFVEPHIPKFAQFELYKGKRVLEIGCGIGADGVEFSKHGAHYVGIDISEKSLAIAKQRFEVYNLVGEFHLLSGDDPLLSNFEKFDLVYSFGVLHHYPNIENIIQNTHCILNESGEFKFMVYAKNSWKNAMIRKGLDRYEAQDSCPLANTYTTEEIYSLLNQKFILNQITQDHCFMFNVADYKKRIYTLEPWFEAMSEDMRSAIKESLGWHLLVTAKKL